MTPAKVQLATLTTPATAVRLVQPARVPPLAVSVTVVAEEVTTLLPESSTFTTGWDVNIEPEAPATGELVTTSIDGAPGPVGVMAALVADNPKAASVATNV